MDKDHVVVTWFYSDTTGRVEEEMYTSDKAVQFQGYYKPWKFLDHHVPVAPLDEWEIQKVYGMLDEWAELVRTAGDAAMRGENKTLVTRCDLKFTSFQPVVKSKPRETYEKKRTRKKERTTRRSVKLEQKRNKALARLQADKTRRQQLKDREPEIDVPGYLFADAP
jgi:hypothetical protein